MKQNKHIKDNYYTMKRLKEICSLVLESSTNSFTAKELSIIQSLHTIAGPLGKYEGGIKFLSPNTIKIRAPLGSPDLKRREYAIITIIKKKNAYLLNLSKEINYMDYHDNRNRIEKFQSMKKNYIGKEDPDLLLQLLVRTGFFRRYYPDIRL